MAFSQALGPEAEARLGVLDGGKSVLDEGTPSPSWDPQEQLLEGGNTFCPSREAYTKG